MVQTNRGNEIAIQPWGLAADPSVRVRTARQERKRHGIRTSPCTETAFAKATNHSAHSPLLWPNLSGSRATASCKSPSDRICARRHKKRSSKWLPLRSWKNYYQTMRKHVFEWTALWTNPIRSVNLCNPPHRPVSICWTIERKALGSLAGKLSSAKL